MIAEVLCLDGLGGFLGRLSFLETRRGEMLPTRRSFYERERATAYNLWRGPRSLNSQGDREFCGGPCVLRLGLRQGTSSTPQIEARAAYASFYSEELPDAIVRAMSWESKSMKRNSRGEMLEHPPFTIPAKFVQVPLGTVQQWVRKFDSIQTTLQLTPHEADSLPICSLRIETNSVYNAFEKVWQVSPDEQSELLRAWLEVWHEMGIALQTYPAMTDVEESFPCVEGRPEVYDLQSYQPLLTLAV